MARCPRKITSSTTLLLALLSFICQVHHCIGQNENSTIFVPGFADSSSPTSAPIPEGEQDNEDVEESLEDIVEEIDVLTSNNATWK